MANRAPGSQFTGTCKFWNAVKGYGFLIPDDGGQELFVSQHDLVTGNEGFRALVAGTRVKCTYTIAENGKAIGKNVTGANGKPLKSFKDMYTAKREIESAKPADPNKLYGTIKWFNAPKSFGFIVPQAGGEDIFFHFSECLKAIVPKEGDAVEYALKEDKTGKTIASKVKNKTQKGAKGAAPPNVAPATAVPQYMGYAQPVAAYPAAFAATAYGGFGKKSGVVKFFDEEKGYGFIVPNHGGRDIHVHKSNVMGGQLVKDEAVEYDEAAINGKMQATAVTRVTSGPKRGGDAQAGHSAAKRPRVVYDAAQQAVAQPAYGAEYQYFDSSATARYY